LNAANWYIPGLQSGDCGGGKYESSALPFAFLPAKFIVVKDLNITAKWSEEDRKYINNSASFGPFWVETESNSNTLKHPGMQIIAWLCQVMPVLPPVSDPSAAATATAPTG
jgi:2-oxoglutarate dehydrogenase E2 component (dihydrolipoamide succinyltransferase)